MTTLTHRDLGPDKRAAEMSDSEDAGHADGAGLPADKRGGARVAAEPGDSADRRRHQAWVPGSAALLTTLLGLSDIVAIFKPDLVHKLHKIDYLVPGTLTTVTRSADVIIGLMLLMLAHGLHHRGPYASTLCIIRSPDNFIASCTAAAYSESFLSHS